MRGEASTAINQQSAAEAIGKWRDVIDGMKLGPMEREIAMLHLEGFAIVMESASIRAACLSRGMKLENQVRASLAALMSAIQVSEQSARETGVNLNAAGI